MPYEPFDLAPGEVPELPAMPIMVHTWDPVTFEYRRSSHIMPDDPVPEGTTTEYPPPSESGLTIVWDGQAWGLVKECRGQTWYDAEGNPVVIDKPGDPADWGLFEQPPLNGP